MIGKEFRVGFCVSGQGRLFKAAADNSHLINMRPVIVLAEKKASADLEQFCESRCIELVRLTSSGRDLSLEIHERCTEAQLDLLCLTFDKLIPAPLVEYYSGKIINVHPALLPAFKGMRALNQVAESGTVFGGATIHEVDEEVDHGPIIAQCVVGLQRTDSADNIGFKVYPLLRRMFLQVLAWYAAGRVEKALDGSIVVRDAVYGDLPISPTPEAF